MVQNRLEEILSTLNEDQQQVAKHIDGPCLVIAGPGSGKTHTVVKRTEALLINGVKPSEVVLFTFTNKAANEIKERVISTIGESAKKMTVGTYHSVCSKYILRRYADTIGYTNKFTIILPEDMDVILKKIIKDKAYDTELKYVKEALADFKKSMTSPQKAIDSAIKFRDKVYANIYKEYQDTLFRTNCMDFDDLLLNTIKVLERNPDIKTQVNRRWRYITADEAHDSSKVDLRIIELLAGEQENVCFILDQDQSIYGFRGANLEAVIKVKDIYTNTKIYNLTFNYRSSHVIVEAAKSLISHNPRLLPKVVEPARDKVGAPIMVSECEDQKTEAKNVARYIKFLYQEKGIEYKDIAVLYRNNALSRNVETALIEARIPYTVMRGVQFFKRKEIQDILSYVRVIANEYDEIAFRRCVQTPRRGLSDKFIDKLVNATIDQNISIMEALFAHPIGKGKAGEKVKAFQDLMKDLINMSVDKTPSNFLKYLIETIDYEKYLSSNTKETEETFADRMQNIDELLTVATEYDNLDDMMAHITLQTTAHEDTEDGDDAEDNKVQLMSMHSSKGLEYRAVLIIGANDRIIPSFKSLNVVSQKEEERRLFYVAITRAKDYLFILYTKKTSVFGQTKYFKKSEFIDEIDKRFIKEMGKKKTTSKRLSPAT